MYKENRRCFRSENCIAPTMVNKPRSLLVYIYRLLARPAYWPFVYSTSSRDIYSDLLLALRFALPKTSP